MQAWVPTWPTVNVIGPLDADFVLQNNNSIPGMFSIANTPAGHSCGGSTFFTWTFSHSSLNQDSSPFTSVSLASSGQFNDIVMIYTYGKAALTGKIGFTVNSTVTAVLQNGASVSYSW